MASGGAPEFLAEADFFPARSLALNLTSILGSGFDIEQFDVYSADPFMLPSEVLLLLLPKFDSLSVLMDIAIPLK